MIDKRFTYLIVIKQVESDKVGNIIWLCKCDCGNITVLNYFTIKSGRTKSCGCLRYDSIPRGNKHSNWNPDRDTVKKNKKIYDFVRSCIHRTLKNKTKFSYALLGYTKEELIDHLETQFDDEMNWDNYGKYWHIDHIKPISLFIKEGTTDPKIVNKLDSLRSLPAIENFRKSNKYEEKKL